MKNHKSGTWCCVVCFACIAFFIGCARQQQIEDAIALWNRYVDIVRSGDESALKSLFATESQPFVRLSRATVARMKQAELRFVKATASQAYIKLHVMADLGDSPHAVFYYVVQTSGGPRMQYPFAVLASDWPTICSQHFVFHQKMLPGGLDRASDSSALLPDTTRLEGFRERLGRLTNIDPPQIFHYYLCADEFQVGELTGIPDWTRSQFGSSVISSHPYDLQVVANAVMQDLPRGFDFLDYGIPFWGELERARGDDTTGNSGMQLVATYVFRLDSIPIESLIAFRQDIPHEFDSLSRQAIIIGGAVIDHLLERSDDSTFAALNRNSRDSETFAHQLDLRYGLSVDELGWELRAKYSLYRPDDIDKVIGW